MVEGQLRLDQVIDMGENEILFESAPETVTSPFVRRIYDLAAELKVPIGDLEIAGGVSKGYLSRLKKSENPEGTIPAKTLLAIADKLKVPVEYFTQEDYDALTPSESKVLTFLHKIHKDTVEQRQEWDRDDIGYLNLIQRSDPLDFSEAQLEEHPLYTWLPNEVYMYTSRFYKGVLLQPAGSFFHTFLRKQNVTLYIAKVEKANIKKAPTIYEVYLVSRPAETGAYPEPIAICNTELSRNVFSDVVRRLYMAAEESSTHIKINGTTESLLDSFISEEGEATNTTRDNAIETLS